jgi:hypothetical protein
MLNISLLLILKKRDIKMFSLNQIIYVYYSSVYYKDDQFLYHIGIHPSKFDQLDHMIFAYFYLQQLAKDHD